MATELGSAFISVGLGTNNLAGDIKKAFGSAEASGADAGKSAGKGFGIGFAGIAASAVGALGIGAFFKSAISGAGDLEQSVGAIDSVFKGSAAQMHGWAKSAATDVGLTQNEFNQLGTLIGSQLKNGGTAMDELGPKTKALITTGADLASMFGGTTQEAVDALSSALKGERDPIEKYGVSLNQAKIDAEAAALGFKKVGGSLSAEANQAATVSLIMKQTADAHGNFGRETDTLAHKQQVLNAQWADGKAAIGAALLPAVTAATGALSKALGPAMAGALAGTKAVVGGFTAMGAAFKAGGTEVTSSGFAGVMERIGLAARQAFDGLGPIVSSVGALLAPLLPMFSALVPQVFALFHALSPTSLIFQALMPVLPQIAAAIGGVLAAILPLALSLGSQLLPIITQLVSAVLPPLIDIFNNIFTAIAPLITQIAGLLIPIIQALMPVVVTVFGVIADVIKSAMQIVQGVIQVVTGLITGNWSKVWEGIGNVFGGIWNTIVALVGGAIKVVWSVIQSGLSLAAGIVGSILGNIGKFFGDTWRNVTDGISRFVGGIGNFFKDIPGNIMNALSGAGRWLFDLGANIVQGLFDGIKSLAGTIGNFFLSLLPGWIVEPFKIALGIHSPSRVFKGFGENIGQGLLDGVDRMQGKIDGTMGSLVTVPQVPSFGSPAYTPAAAGFGSVGGATFNTTINQVDDPIGTSHAVTRRLASLGT